MNRTFLFILACVLSMGLQAQTVPTVEVPTIQVPTIEIPAVQTITVQAPTVNSPSAIAQGVDFNFQSKEQETDMDALRRWLQDKRLVSLKELGGDLSISGEVRSEMKFINEKLKAQDGTDFIQQRGISSATEKPKLPWDVEFNLMMDYHTDRTWAAMKVEFDNVMGTRSGTASNVKLEKAYLGGRLIAMDTFTWDAEIGRRYLGNAFDSKLQFGSLFDGGLFRFSKAFEDIGDFYANAAVFVINTKANHYGEALEIGALKIANSPFNMRYSIINWYRRYSQEELQNGTPQDKEFVQPWRYLVNQYTLFYQAYPKWLGKRLFKVYGAGLWNPLAKRIEQTHHRKQNWGAYAGVSLGTVKKANDWALDLNYQYAQAQVAPGVDCSGMSRGNAAGAGFFTQFQDGRGPITDATNAFSPFDYQGFEIDALYAFTSNLTVQQHFSWSWTLHADERKHEIGPNDITKIYELEFIYAF